MSTKQLNVWIQEDLRDHIARRAEQEKRPMNDIVAELVRDDIARRYEQFAEHNSLLVMQEIIATEIHQAHIQLRSDLREDWQQAAASLFEGVWKHLDRLMSLLVITVRNSGIIRRLVYTLLSKVGGSSFAKAAYDDAKEKVSQELTPKKLSIEHMLIEDDQLTVEKRRRA